MIMKNKRLISGFLFLFLFASLVIVASDKPTKEDTPKLPDNVKMIIDKSCFACHNSDSRNEDAISKKDFKKLASLSMIKKISAYKHIGDVVEKNEMPPKKFLENKPEKKLTDKEKEILISWAKKEAEALVKNK